MADQSGQSGRNGGGADMGVNINFRKDYGMDPQTLLAQIRAWRKAGYTDEEIQAELDNLERDPERQREGDAHASL